MNSDSSNSIQRWWHEQRNEHAMPATDICEKAKSLDSTTRRWKAVGILLILYLVADSAWEIARSEDWLVKAGNIAMIAAAFYIAWRYRRHVMAATPVVLGRTNCLEFYRSELVRQRSLSQDGWGYILPFAPGLGLIVLGRAMDSRTVAEVILLTLLAAGVFVVIAWMNARSVRRLQRELDAVDPASEHPDT